MKRTVLFILSLVILALPTSALLTSAAPARQTPAMVPVKFAATSSTSLSPLFIAIENGYFQDEGLDMQFVEVNSGPLGEAAVLTGQAQFTNGIDVEDVINLQKEGKDLIFVYNMINGLTMDLVVRKDALQKMGVTHDSPLADREKALKGLTLGISSAGASTDLYTRWLVLQAGLDPDTDVHIVAIGSNSARLAALEAGQIDAYLGTPPYTYIAEQQGIGSILINNTHGDIPQFREFAYSAVATSKSWAEANPEVVEGFSRGLDHAYEFMVEHTDEAVRILQAKYFPESDFDTLKLSILATMMAMSPEGRLSAEAIEHQANVSLTVGSIDALPDTSEGVLWTNEWNPDTLADIVLPTVEPMAALTPEATQAS